MTFPVLSALLLALLLGVALGALLTSHLSGRNSEAPLRDALASQIGEQARVRDGLGRLEQQLHRLDGERAAWQSQLRQQVTDVRHSTDLLRRETGALSTALRKPQVRGRWGEMHLRRAVEHAGLVNRCDFNEQVQCDDGTNRPDLVVNLPSKGVVVVDAKVPLDAFLNATEAHSAGNTDLAEAEMKRHANQLATHVSQLASKEYFRSVPTSPEFVVLFLPAESFLSAALDVTPALLDDAAAKRVVLATPTTLIALLRTVAWGWSQEALADKAEEIGTLGKELHTRLGVVCRHLDKLGASLNTAVGAYNATVGSVESRVLVTSRKFADLDVVDTVLETPRLVESAARPPTAAELLDDQRSGVNSTPHAEESRRGVREVG